MSAHGFTKRELAAIAKKVATSEPLPDVRAFVESLKLPAFAFHRMDQTAECLADNIRDYAQRVAVQAITAYLEARKG